MKGTYAPRTTALTMIELIELLVLIDIFKVEFGLVGEGFVDDVLKRLSRPL
jgi:hypothetical protein